VAADLLAKVGRIAGRRHTAGTFSAVLERGLGRTICRDFYFPYARKVWGVEPEELSVTQASRRVSANSLSKMLKKALSAVPGLKPPGSGRFFYPRQGYGQISEAFCLAAQDAGAQIHLNSRVQAVEVSEGAVQAIHYEKDGELCTIRPEYMWSTIPITSLARCVTPCPPPECLLAAEHIEYRSMILIYLVLEQDRFSEYDAHYFPEPEIPISRLSEPKNYRDGQGSAHRTVLCAELPCALDDPQWSSTDEALGRYLCSALAAAGIPVQAPIKEVVTRRLGQAYPIYRRGYEVSFERLDHWLSQINGLLTFGRQGLFAHDNTHHALYMGYCAAGCLDANGRFDAEQWRAFRRVFETHVVED
jgi:protoporphyrinogen oxidase